MPGEMRAATCNDFLCDGLQFLRDRLKAGMPARTLFVSVEDVTIVAARFVDASPAQEDQPSCCSVTPPAQPARG